MHQSQIRKKRSGRRRAAGVGVPFPEGVPTATGTTGCFVAPRYYLPVTVLFRDWDFLWVRAGKGSFELRDGTALLAGADDFVVVPPYVPVKVCETTAVLKFQYCHCVFRPLPDLRPAHEHRADLLGPGMDVRMPLVFSASEAPDVKRAYVNLTKTWTRTAARPWRFQRALLEIVSAIAAFARERTERGAIDRLLQTGSVVDERVEQIKKRIDAEPTRAWSVAELADDVGLSTGHLHALCRASLGMSLKDYIVEMRQRRALRLLKTPADDGLPTIREVSEACGFSSQHFFSRQFKGRFGLTPLRYRNGAGVES